MSKKRGKEPGEAWLKEQKGLSEKLEHATQEFHDSLRRLAENLAQNNPGRYTADEIYARLLKRADAETAQT